MDMTANHLANAGKMLPVERRRQLNQIALERMRLAIAEADALMADDHVVIGIETTLGLPTVQLAASPRLSAMADEFNGAFYQQGVDGTGQAYRKGVLLNRTEGVRVVWIERGGR